MSIGWIVGAGLLVFRELRVARRYAVTATALDAAGIAVLNAWAEAGVDAAKSTQLRPQRTLPPQTGSAVAG